VKHGEYGFPVEGGDAFGVADVNAIRAVASTDRVHHEQSNRNVVDQEQ
jgi:hypothetical protein